VLVKTEEATVPDSRDVVGQVAMHKTLVHDGNAGFVEGDEGAFDPDYALCENVVACLERGLALGVAREDAVHGRHVVCGGMGMS